jgi:hypothetical protein
VLVLLLVIGSPGLRFDYDHEHEHEKQARRPRLTKRTFGLVCVPLFCGEAPAINV